MLNTRSAIIFTFWADPASKVAGVVLNVALDYIYIEPGFLQESSRIGYLGVRPEEKTRIPGNKSGGN